MINVSMAFDNVDAAALFFRNYMAGAASVSKPVFAPLAQIKTDAPQPTTVTTTATSGEATGAAAIARRPGRPPKKTEHAQPAVASNTGSGSPTQSSDAQTSGGAPSGDGQAAQPPVTPATGSAVALTLQNVKDVAMQVTAKLGEIEGQAKLREILAKDAGVKLIRDIPADKFDAVIKACQAVIA